MTPMEDRPTCDDDRRFDLLADGELDEIERRELLTSLEHQPDGWRRCALAFLEAQCWKQALGGPDRTPQVPREGSSHTERDEYAPGGTGVSPVSDRHGQDARGTQPSKRGQDARGTRRRLGGHLATLAAMAACFLVALAVGTQLPQLWNGRTGAPGPAPGAVVDRQPAAAPKGIVPPSDPNAGNWRTVRLSVPDGPQGNGRAIELPVVERPGIDPAWVESLPPSVDQELLRNLQQLGFQVRQRRGVMPFDMNDGRQLVVPVDRVEVQYVGNPAY